MDCAWARPGCAHHLLQQDAPDGGRIAHAPGGDGIDRLPGVREGLEPVPRTLDRPQLAADAVLERHRFGEVPMEIAPNNPPVSRLFRRSGSRRPHRTYRSVLSAHPGEPRGRRWTGPGARPALWDRFARTDLLSHFAVLRFRSSPVTMPVKRMSAPTGGRARGLERRKQKPEDDRARSLCHGETESVAGDRRGAGARGEAAHPRL